MRIAILAANLLVTVGCATTHGHEPVLAEMSVREMFPDEEVRRLAIAAGNGDVATIHRQVERGMDVNAQGVRSATPLFWALRDLGGFKALLSLGADPNVVFADGGSVMHWAARMSDSRFLQAAIMAGGDPNLRAGPYRGTPIFSVVGYGATHNIDVLLAAGADIDARLEGATPLTKISRGNTPLIAAASAGDYATVHHLLIRGADFSLTNDVGNSLADYLAADRNVIVPESPRGQSYQRVVTWIENHAPR